MTTTALILALLLGLGLAASTGLNTLLPLTLLLLLLSAAARFHVGGDHAGVGFGCGDRRDHRGVRNRDLEYKAGMAESVRRRTNPITEEIE